MIRIIHLSDFHLNKQNLKDWNEYVKPAFLKQISNINNEKGIDIIACTGDLIDKGGVEFTSITEAFNKFDKEVREPITKKISLDKERFMFVPGNHDIDRNADDEPIDMGYISYFNKEYDNISKFMLSAMNNGKRDAIKRIIPFKDFEQSYYGNKENNKLSVFGSSFKFELKNTKVGVACLNSSWRAYNRDDRNNLIIGEEQLNFNSKFISDCEIKIALMHHPTDWLLEKERQIISNHISKEYNIQLVGHVHLNRTSMQTGLSGSLFINLAPAYINDIRTDSKAFGNGFTLIDFDNINKTIEGSYYKYDLLKKEYILNDEIAEDGIFSYNIPTENSLKDKKLIERVLNYIEDERFEEINEHLLNQKAKKENIGIKESFILPPIDEGNFSNADKEPMYITLNQIIKTKQNQIFFGNQETGKTTLLYRLVTEFVEEFEYIRKIPVYIDFNEIGNKDIITCIKTYLSCGTNEANQLIDNNSIILLIDNLAYRTSSPNNETKKLHRFNKEYEHISIIAASETNISGVAPINYINLCNIPFKKFFIRDLKVKQIKNLMSIWLPNEDTLVSDVKLQKMVNSFISYALPCTAMSVSLFLWSTESHDRKPINSSVLLDIYIELILEKIGVNNIYRDTFDYRNKSLLISVIAQEMLLKNDTDYCIAYSEYLSVIEDYLKNKVGFDYDSNKIAEYLIDRKIFIKYQSNRIKFSKSSFFHFFLAKRMEYDKKFKEYVLQEDNYFKFQKEIEYYSGLTRNDIDLLKIIYERFLEKFEPTDFILEKIEVDDYFTKVDNKEFEPKSNQIEISSVKKNRPTKEQLEEIYDKRLAQIKNPYEILKKNGNLSLDQLIIIMSNVLRNSEGVEALQLKKDIYRSIVKYSLTWSILYRELIVNYVVVNKKMPPSVPSNFGLRYLMQNLPFHVQMGLHQQLGTYKLAPIVKDRIKEDKKQKMSDVESFFSVALYSDIKGRDFPEVLKKFIKKINKKGIVIDYIFRKIVNYYYSRTKKGSANEKIYLDLLAELQIKSKNLPRRMKSKIIKTFEDNKKLWFDNNND